MQHQSALTNRMRRILFAASLCASLSLTTVWISAVVADSTPKKLARPSVTSRTNQTETAKEKAKNPNVDSFIIEAVEGGSSCREATADELKMTLPRPDDRGVEIKQLRVPGLNSTGPNSPNALTINLVALSQLQSDPDMANVVAAFQKSAANWTAQIKNPVTISINIDYGVNAPSGAAFPANVLGSTSSKNQLIDYAGARTNLVASASNATEAGIYGMLPNSFVPTDTGNGSVVSASRSVAFALGIPVSTPADPNVATIGFNKNFAFDFNPDDGINPGTTDFVAVATHEIGHALGFSSNAGVSVTTPPKLWDLYRFRPGTTAGTFPTANRILSIGGPTTPVGANEQVYFTSQTFTIGFASVGELRLSTGGPSAVTTSGGDGRQSSHWKDDALTGEYIGIMDPTISSNVVRQTTANDFSTLETIGWNLISATAPPSAPPVPPPPANDNFANAQVISGCTGSVTGSNVGATKETGEPNSPDSSTSTRSVWYQWQAPSTNNVTITTEGSRFDTVLAVYAGSSLATLGTAIVHNDDIPDVGGQHFTTSSVTFAATAGTTYRININGFDNGDGAEFGNIQLNWNCAGATPTPTATATASPTASASPGTCTSGNKLQDPSFEATSLSTFINPFWISTSTNFGTSLCTVAACGGGGTEVPRTGTFWTWFGGVDEPENGTVSQTVTIPAGATATLNFFLRIGGVAAPFTDVLNVKVDGATVQTINEPTVAETAYTQRSVNLNAFANGGSHTIVLEYNCPAGGGVSNFNVDDVTLDITCPSAGGLIQLSSSTFNIQEDCTSLDITVNRTGDTSGAATVDYTTADVTASERRDYITAVGKLSFAAGETQKTITVLINEDSFAEGNETFTVSLSNPSGATLGTSVTTVTINDDPSEPGTNAIDDPSTFVCQQYHDFLSRQPDASGLAFWTGGITACGANQACIDAARVNVSAAFYLSIEFQQTGYLVERMYKTAYGSATGTSTFPSLHQLFVPIVRLSEFLPDTQRIGQGVIVGQGNWEQVLEANKQAFASEFVQRSRFTTAFPTNQTPAQLVDALNANAGTVLSASERTTAINLFGGAGNTTNVTARAQALRQIAEDADLVTSENNRAFVLMQFYGYLRRDPNSAPDSDYTGYDFWLTKLNQFNGNYQDAEMVKAFITAIEYRQRFGQ